MTEKEMEIWNGHAWALSVLASKIGPMTEEYDSYNADEDLKLLSGIIKHAEWLKKKIK